MITAQALNGSDRVRHAFFTREGGVSEGVFRSLNCGFGSGDDPGRVAENRARAMTRMGGSGDLVTLYQVHSATVVVVDEGFDAAAQAPEADAAVSRRPGVALGILTADCAPVLLADSGTGVVGAAHAGWRGALAGVVEACVEAMVTLGARPEGIAAAIGPCIGQESYEVGPELKDVFVTAESENARFFVAGRDGRFQFDLAGFLVHRLEAAGIGAVEAVPGDTCADNRRFFSYRRATLEGEADYGRALSVIELAG